MEIGSTTGQGRLLDACDRLVARAEAPRDGEEMSDVGIGLVSDRVRAILDAAEDCSKEFEHALRESPARDVKHFRRGLHAVGQTTIWTLSAVRAGERAGTLYYLGQSRFSLLLAAFWIWMATRRRKGALKWARSARALAGIGLARTHAEVRKALAER